MHQTQLYSDPTLILTRLSFPPFNLDIDIQELPDDPDVRQQVPRDPAGGEFRARPGKGEIRNDLIREMRINGTFRAQMIKKICACLVRHCLRPLPDGARGCQSRP